MNSPRQDLKIHSVVLAAGLSRRMNSAHTNKVCLELLGKPVICRVVQALEDAGITSHTAVIGACAGEVLKCLDGKIRNLSYAFQSRQLGPAEALDCAVRSLPENLAPDTLILTVPGHRILSPEILHKLLEFYQTNDFKLAGLKLVDEKGGFVQDLSIFLGRLDHIRQGLELLQERFCNYDGNEIALSELSQILNSDPAAALLAVKDKSQVIGFNDPAELLEAAEILRRREGAGCGEEPDDALYHPLSQWLKDLSAPGENALSRALSDIYGGDKEFALRRKAQMLKLMEYAAGCWSTDTPVTLVRSPGRVNVMGRHVDHQGGNCNLMTIGCETLIAARLRSDDKVTLQNLDAEFAPAGFSIGELVRDLPWDDWQTLVGSKKLARLLKQYGVNWADYIKAVFLRFQKHFDHKKLHGMDMIVSGNVPMAAGLSSSSTLVVGAAEAVVSANRLDLEPDKLVTLCGEGEWFVGTRGGAADHAAVKLGACNKVVKVGFFDFKVEKKVDFPSDHALIVCDSRIQARKSGNAKNQFNHRVSCYRIGLLLLKKFYPQYAARLHHLRDFNCKNLNIPLEWLYKLLTVLPENAGRHELEKLLPGEDLTPFWQNHQPPADGLYPIRGVVFYGLAECARAARYVDILQKDIRQVGEMMNISHNGDRVMRFDGAGNALGEYFFDTSDLAVEKLIDQLKSNDPAAVEAAALWRQPGSYRCSLPEIDLMADLACSVPGVAGAQLAGAGLGGCMMVLVRNDSISELYDVLNKRYYQPRDLEPGFLHCRPIAGAGAVSF